MGFWKTVWAGVLVIGIVKVLELSATHLPTWLGWLGTAATKLWEWLSYSISFPVVLFIPVAWGIFKLLGEIDGLKEEIDERDYEKSAMLHHTKEDMRVLEALARCEPPVGFDDLLPKTGLTRLRLMHSISKLRGLELLMPSENEEVWFTEDGLRFIVENDIDKPGGRRRR